jgi:GMP synthase (glutamine-hydrolysing)
MDSIAILDLGGGKSADIARSIRAMGVYSEIYPHDISVKELMAHPGVRGIVVDGGSCRAYPGQVLTLPEGLYACGVPVLTVGFGEKPDYAAWPENSKIVLKAFLDLCGARHSWTMQNFIDDQVARLRKEIGEKKVILALSGGVDSSVVCALLYKAIGKNLICVHVNHGLMRKGEPEQVVRVFREEMGVNLIYVDATERYLEKLAGVSDPEEKRMIIGGEFIDIFVEEANRLSDVEFLGQGTIYPDILESGTKTAPVVKSHHNVGGLPSHVPFTLVEPLKYLFKDEVRAVGEALGLPHGMVYRQPFPGPGLGVRCIGAITRDRLEAVRESDAILREEFEKCGLAGKVWQYFTVVPDVRSTGVRDGERSYEWPVILRAVNTVDAMTATVEPIPYDVLDAITRRITREVKGVNRVLYDVTPKPVATIEWE